MRASRLALTLIAFEASFVPMIVLSLRRSSFFLEHIQTFDAGRKTAYVLTAALLLAGYGAIVWLLLRGERLSRRAWSLALVVLLALCLATPPFLSRDTAAYAITGRGILAGLDPYVTPLYGLQPVWAAVLGPTWWLRFPSIYGPLFDLSAAALMLAPARGLLAAMFVWKLAGAGGFVVSVICLRKIVGHLRLPSWIVPAYAFNPAVLIHAVVEGHNDIFVLAGLLGASYFYLKRAHLRGAGLLGAVMALKFFPAILLPLYVLDRERTRTKIDRLAAAVGVFLLSAVPFGFPFPAIVRGLGVQTALPCLYACSPFVTAADALVGSPSSRLRLAAALALYAVIAWRFFATKRTADPAALFGYVFWTLSVFFFVQIRWLAPWYMTLLVPFGLLLAGKRGYLPLTLALTTYGLLQYAG